MNKNIYGLRIIYKISGAYNKSNQNSCIHKSITTKKDRKVETEKCYPHNKSVGSTF